MTFTKEQLIASAHSRIEFAEMMLADNPEPLKERTWSIELELARIALAALESRADAEPVVLGLPGIERLEEVLEWIGGLPVPTKAATANYCRLKNFIIDYRSAMLQGKAETVSQPLAFFDGDISSEDTEKIMDRLREMNSRPGCQQQIISEPASQPYALPEGYVLVPVEPTAEMQSAAASAIRFETTPINKLWTGNAVYKAMLAAAPQQAAE